MLFTLQIIKTQLYSGKEQGMINVILFIEYYDCSCASLISYIG